MVIVSALIAVISLPNVLYLKGLCLIDGGDPNYITTTGMILTYLLLSWLNTFQMAWNNP